jgi:hypothetical protein
MNSTKYWFATVEVQQQNQSMLLRSHYVLYKVKEPSLDLDFCLDDIEWTTFCMPFLFLLLSHPALDPRLKKARMVESISEKF